MAWAQSLEGYSRLSWAHADAWRGGLGGEGMALHWASLSWKVNYRGATWVPPRGKGQETVTCWQLDRGWLFPK